MVDSNLDGHKLHLHPEKVAEWKYTGDTTPVHVEIGLTGRCNHKCVFCALEWVDNKTDIDTSVVSDALKDMGKNNVKSVMFGGEGEPLLHKDIGLLTQLAKHFGIDVSLTSNGVLFNEQKQEQMLPYLSWAKFSIDAGDSQTYALVHGTSSKTYKKLMSNLENAVNYKHRHSLDVTIGTQAVMIPQNMKTISKLAERLSDIGVDYLAIKPFSHHPLSENDFSIPLKDYNSLEREVAHFSDKKYKVKFRKETLERINEENVYSKCYGLPFITLIDSKGSILPCNLYYNNPGFFYGNLNQQSFGDIWWGENRKAVLEKIDKQGVGECRKGCRCDASNRYLQRIKHPELHDNFT